MDHETFSWIIHSKYSSIFLPLQTDVSLLVLIVYHLRLTTGVHAGAAVPQTEPALDPQRGRGCWSASWSVGWDESTIFRHQPPGWMVAYVFRCAEVSGAIDF